MLYPFPLIFRCASLSQVNSLLREQLDQAGTVNVGLTESLWRAREDADLCDSRLRREQEVRRTTKTKCLSEKTQQRKLKFIPSCSGVVQLNSR